jgi:hypothetical protein
VELLIFELDNSAACKYDCGCIAVYILSGKTGTDISGLFFRKRRKP